ncbi:EspA/EspE family type VII secretion system effector [Mycolicibacterium goodii]|uniref:Uncharacterized protein n=1 Tax=Mycolicibacterium goodii TaxID=134601 RepID=A0A0K0X072_MYCGD|nr:hypothetical protein AFA91_01370 [Mycolicibacterium goodii]
MSVLDGFYSTLSKARQTFGEGPPNDGAEFDQSSQLLQMKASVEAAAPDDRWQGSGADAYAAANKEHAAVYEKLADLDRRMAAEVKNAAGVVSSGRQDLDSPANWVNSAVQSLPPTSEQDRERKLLPIAREGISQVNGIVQSATAQMVEIKGRITGLKGEYESLSNQKFAPGGDKSDEDKNEKDGDVQSVMGDDADKDERDGKADGEALAEQANLPPAHRDPAVLDEVAANLPESPLTAEQMAALAAGEEVNDVPKETLDYYRDFYNAAGKDGLLLLDRHLESQEADGNAEAGAQRDRLANGLTLTSNEKVVELNPDGSVAARGGYDQLPPDLREMLEVRRADPAYPGWETLGPTEAKNQHVADVVQFSELIGEANPGYQPGTQLGAEMYLKSADMVENSTGGWGMTDTAPESYERAASSLAEVAGRNNESSYKIWSGDGMPEGYDPKETVRTLIGHDWSQSGGGGSGAATVLDWITEDSQRPVGDAIGDRARQAFVDLPDYLAPSDTDPVWDSQRDAFARNPAISTEMSQLLASHTNSLVAPGQQNGFVETRIDPEGYPRISADDANRLLELGSYSEEGRATLTTAAEHARIEELEAAMRNHPGILSEYVANSPAGALSGRIDNAMTEAITNQNEVLQQDVVAKDAVYRAKVAGAELAGTLADELTPKIPRVGEVIGYTGLDPGGIVESSIKHFIDTPEYQAIVVPDDDILMAKSNLQAQQAVLEAAMKAGELPDELKHGNSPVQISELGPGSREYQIVQKYLIERGLAQYVTDYAQSYSIALK